MGLFNVCPCSRMTSWMPCHHGVGNCFPHHRSPSIRCRKVVVLPAPSYPDETQTDNRCNGEKQTASAQTTRTDWWNFRCMHVRKPICTPITTYYPECDKRRCQHTHNTVAQRVSSSLAPGVTPIIIVYWCAVVRLEYQQTPIIQP